MNIAYSMHDYQNQTTVQNEDIKRTCEAMISAMKDGLPPEAHTTEVFDYVLQECGQILHRKTLNL